jgi:hypothetical protein
MSKHGQLNNDISNNLSDLKSGLMSPTASNEKVGKSGSLQSLEKNRGNVNLATTMLNESSQKELHARPGGRGNNEAGAV